MLCEAVCGLDVTLSQGKVTGVRGDADDPFSQGYLCPKAAAIGDIMADPDRVRTPLRRGPEGFVPMDWHTALDQASARIADVQRRYGRDAVALYLGNPTVHSHGALLAAPYLSRALGTRQRYSATSVDQLPHMMAALEMFGHQLLLPVPDLDRCDFLLILGANPAVSNGSLMTAPGMPRRLKALRARGGRVVVIDPRRTETAELADAHHFIRPGGDAALLLAMLHTLFAEGLVNLGRLDAFTEGLEALRGAVVPFAPGRVAARTGLSAETIRDLARSLAASPRAAVYGRLGACTQEFGGVTAWLLYALNLVTGNLDRPGGLMFSGPAADLVGLASLIGHRGHRAVWHSRVKGLPEFGGELPAATLVDEIETPGPGQVRALITVAGNPVLSTPDGSRLAQALSKLEVMVSVDVYRNETTRHADYILPTSFGFERDHYDLAFYALAVRNVARFTPALVPPPPGVREDFDVLLSLARGVRAHGGGRPSRSLDLTLAALHATGSRRAVDGLLRAGPYGLRRGRKGLSVASLQEHPSGVDLGPLVPCLPERLGHADRRVRLAPTCYLDDLGRVAADLDTPPPGLVLIGRRQLRSNNSWMHNATRLVKGPVACTLQMHPDDATARGLADGQTVTLRGGRGGTGAVEAPLEVTAEVSPGVVSLPHGWGHAAAGGGLRVAEARAGVSINDVVDGDRHDPLSGVAALSGGVVTVEAR